MTQTVLPQLQEISDDLLAQEKALTAQLAEVQEKLRGVRAILPLFGEVSSGLGQSDEAPDDESDEDDFYDEAPVVSRKPSTAKASKVTKAKSGGRATATKTAVKAEKKPKAAVEKSADKSAGAKVAAKKKDGRAASWQKYTRPGVKETSIPEAVRLVLETQPDKSFKIAEVMDALFNETMPKSQHLKARNRISNVLSGGVRNGEWFKGDRGTYRLSSD
jgi:hypothetical protein